MRSGNLNPIESFFLRAKAWQIFLLVFGVGLVVLATIPFWTTSIIAPRPAFGRDQPALEVVSFLSMLCYLVWLWSMGSFLDAISKPALRIKMGFFYFSVIYPPFYHLALIVFSKNLTSVSYQAIVLPGLLYLLCYLHNIFFVSATLVMAETGRPTTSFFDYWREFFLLLLYPLGVWNIQPRINRLHAERNHGELLAGATAS